VTATPREERSETEASPLATARTSASASMIATLRDLGVTYRRDRVPPGATSVAGKSSRFRGARAPKL